MLLVLANLALFLAVIGLLRLYRYITTPLPPSIRGSFEIQITCDPCSRQDFSRTCKQLKLQTLPIYKGFKAYCLVTGMEQDARSRTDHITKAFREAGLPVSQIKIDANASNEGIPREVPHPDASHYFEFQIILSSRYREEESQIREITLRHNALFLLQEGSTDRWRVLLKIHGMGRDRAFTTLNVLLESLGNVSSYTVERKYCILDSKRQ